MATYYELLGIETTATAKEVGRAIRRYLRHLDEQLPEEKAALINRAVQTLRDPRRRELYDRAHAIVATPVNLPYSLYRLFQLRDELAAAQRQQRVLEAQVANYKHDWQAREMHDSYRAERRYQLGRAALGLLVTVAIGVGLRACSAPSTLLGQQVPYEPIAVGEPLGYLLSKRVGTAYQQVELMPQFRGGAGGLRRHIRERLLAQLPVATTDSLLAATPVSMVIDSAGYLQQVQVPGPQSSGKAQLLRQVLAQLPRFVPGYQDARPVSVFVRLDLQE